EELKAARRVYEFSLLKTVYDFSLVNATCGALVDYILQHSSSFTDGTLEWLNKLQDYILAMQDVGTRFQSQLQGIYSSQPFDDQLAQDRVKAAAPYFREKLEECIDYIHSSAAGTDSGQHAKEYNDSLKEIFAQQSLKKHLILGLANGFTVEQYHSLKRSFRLPTFSVNSYGSSQSREQTPHPALYMQLKMLRDELCSKSGLPIYMVAGSNTIFEMSQYLPQTLSELKGIKGFGKARIEKYGQLFLDIIISYCQKKGLSSLVEEKPVGKKKAGSKEPKPGKTNTKAVSYQMFREGKSVEQIATERNLKTGTIQEHLAGYIEKGEIPLESLVEAGKIKMIQAVIEELETPTLTDIKVRCDDSVSFGDIRMVMAARKSLLQSGDTAV
ncbi:MAG TPA: helix-turn-helix domain-containing protein, partial [Chitinophagaceae bacterium]|nr:helix-turn-helix domain-containing protein [Chitinophagaceae bacterium]